MKTNMLKLKEILKTLKLNKSFLIFTVAIIFLTTSCKDDATKPDNNPVITNVPDIDYDWKDTVIISGRNFNTTQGNGKVVVSDNLVATVVKWQENQIIITMPDGVVSGFLYVVRDDNVKSNQFSYWTKIDFFVETLLIRKGTFTMGDNDVVTGSILEAEKPEHSVTISYDYYIGVAEITQKQYRTITSRNPFQEQDDQLAANYLTFGDAIAFCNALSEYAELTPCYIVSGNNITVNWNANGYRLPTEAEWEYAARYNSASNNKFGFNGNASEYAWWYENSGPLNSPKRVKQLKPNNAGLYDMNGNVAEWCWDYFSSNYYNQNAGGVTDPKGPATGGGNRVIRGGSFRDNEINIRATVRNAANEGAGGKDAKIGFRVVRKRI